MSQPRQPTPTQSPTPSKSSLRRTSGPQNPSHRSLIPPPSPRFEDQPAVPVRYSPRSPPNQTLEYESDEDDEPLIYPDPPPVDGPGDDSYFPYPEPERPFQPFFTLIEDGLSSEHHHPSVHYIFADDDGEIITEAALRSLEQDTLTESSIADNLQQESRDDNSPHHGTRLPPGTDGVREHYLILDIHPAPPGQAQSQPQTQHQSHPHAHPHPYSYSHSHSHSHLPPDFTSSYTVTSSTSLSPHWQITRTSIVPAPTMGDQPSGHEDESLMLRIEGRGVPIDDPESDPKSGRGPGGEKESLEEMIERFQARLGEVRRLIEVDGPVVTGMGGGGGDGTVEAYERDRERGMGYGLEEQD